MPCLLVLAILKTLPNELDLATYLEGTVYKKLCEGSVTFEEILLLRLTCDVAVSTSEQRTPEFLEALQRLIPDFELYKQVWRKLAT